MLQLLLLAALALKASSVVIPATGKINETKLAEDACKNVPGGLTVCHPNAADKYIGCGLQNAAGRAVGNKVKKCPGSKVYDYGLRTCLNKKIARRCPRFTCPAPGQFTPGTNGTGQFLGPFGGMDPIIIDLTSTPSTKTYICPVQGHCQAGMIFSVTSLGAAPANRPAQTFHIRFVETNENNVLYPTHTEDIVGYAGDRVNISWPEPIHVVMEFNASASDAAPIVPYQPQPVYKCPVWQVVNITGPMYITNVFPGEKRLMDVMVGPGGAYNLTVDISMNGWFVACPLPPHCRNGQIFKIRIIPLGPDVQPRGEVFPIAWTLTDYQNFPDLNLQSGDVLQFTFPPATMTAQGPDVTTVQPHGITLLPPDLVETYIESPYPPLVFGSGGNRGK